VTSKIVIGICALALPLAAATVASANKGGKHHHHHHGHHGKFCKGEFKYLKGGKCLDSRKKK
jgi:hypothetical protein